MHQTLEEIAAKNFIEGTKTTLTYKGGFGPNGGDGGKQTAV